MLANAGKGTREAAARGIRRPLPALRQGRPRPGVRDLLGDFKLIRAYETGALKLFDIAKDPGERHDLAREMPEKAKELDRRLERLPRGGERPDADAQSELRSDASPSEHGSQAAEARAETERRTDENGIVTNAATLCWSIVPAVADGRRRPSGRQGRRPGQAISSPPRTRPATTCPAHPFDLVLGRPTRDSVTLSVLAYQDAEGRIAYGTQRTSSPPRRRTRRFKKGEPVEIGDRPPAARHQVFLSVPRRPAIPAAEGTFHTQRRRAGRSRSPSRPTRTSTTASAPRFISAPWPTPWPTRPTSTSTWATRS